MTIYTILEKKQKYRRPFSSSNDFKYFIEHRHLLGGFKRFAQLYDSEENEFDIIRANTLIQGLENKRIFESEIKNIATHREIEHVKFVTTLRERTVDQPYFESDGEKIYIPFFSSALNEIYVEEPEKLLDVPYSELQNNYEDASIDPFDTYGFELYNSYFSSLVKISSSKHVAAFFHYDTDTVYFINDQGRLDAKLVLFDKYIKRPTHTHMLERIAPVAEAYFNNDKVGMINALKDNNLISSQMQKILLEHK